MTWMLFPSPIGTAADQVNAHSSTTTMLLLLNTTFHPAHKVNVCKISNQVLRNLQVKLKRTKFQVVRGRQPLRGCQFDTVLLGLLYR